LGDSVLTKTRVPIDQRALLARANRALAAENFVLRKTKGRKARPTLGEFYLLNTKTAGIAETHINLEEFCRKRGVLKEYETLAE